MQQVAEIDAHKRRYVIRTTASARNANPTHCVVSMLSPSTYRDTSATQITPNARWKLAICEPV